jgi:hypothetical protein
LAASSVLLIFGKAVFGLAGLVLGIHLIASSRGEARRGPQALAAAMIFVGGIGLIAIPIGRSMGDTATATALILCGELLERAGVIGLCVFLCQVFRPASRAARWLALLCAVLLLASLWWDAASQQSWSSYDEGLPSSIAVQLALSLPFLWSTFDTTTHWRRTRRRLALDLVEPMVCHRFLLWALGSLYFVSICWLACLAGWASGAGHSSLAAVASSMRGILFLAIAAGIWLVMFTPAFYAERVNRGVRTQS